MALTKIRSFVSSGVAPFELKRAEGQPVGDRERDDDETVRHVHSGSRLLERAGERLLDSELEDVGRSTFTRED